MKGGVQLVTNILFHRASMFTSPALTHKSESTMYDLVIPNKHPELEQIKNALTPTEFDLASLDQDKSIVMY